MAPPAEHHLPYLRVVQSVVQRKSLVVRGWRFYDFVVRRISRLYPSHLKHRLHNLFPKSPPAMVQRVVINDLCKRLQPVDVLSALNIIRGARQRVCHFSC